MDRNVKEKKNLVEEEIHKQGDDSERDYIFIIHINVPNTNQMMCPKEKELYVNDDKFEKMEKKYFFVNQEMKAKRVQIVKKKRIGNIEYPKNKRLNRKIKNDGTKTKI